MTARVCFRRATRHLAIDAIDYYRGRRPVRGGDRHPKRGLGRGKYGSSRAVRGVPAQRVVDGPALVRCELDDRAVLFASTRVLGLTQRS
jgi:hypothetical protein